MLKIERIYTKPFDLNGERILVDRKWARGISKQDAHLASWQKEIAHSNELREWFGHVDAKYSTFKERYFQELDANPATTAFLKTVGKHLQTGNVILLYGAKNTRYNNAVALQAYLEQRLNLNPEADNNLFTIMYNDGEANQSKNLELASRWLAQHPNMLNHFQIRLSDNGNIYHGNNNRAIDHQSLLKLIDSKDESRNNDK